MMSSMRMLNTTVRRSIVVVMIMVSVVVVKVLVHYRLSMDTVTVLMAMIGQRLRTDR